MRVAPWIALLVLGLAALAPLAGALQSPPPPEKGLNGVVSPIPALPAVANSTSGFRLVAAKEVSSVEVFRVYYNASTGRLEVYSKAYKPVLLSSGGGLYTYEVKASLPPGLYDLYITYKDGSKTFDPRSLWVIPGGLERVRVLHMSDLHFGAGDADYKLTAYLLAQAFNATLIINTGDEADTADVHQYYQSLAYRYTFAYSVPEVLVPGNHDYPPGNFYKYYGNTTVICWRPLPWLLVTGGYTWEVGHFTEAQIRAIASCLQANSDARVKVLIMHHPVFYWQGAVKLPPTYPFKDPHKDPHSPLSYYWGAPEVLEKGLLRKLLELIVKYNVTVVLAGHIHRDQYVVYEPPGGGVHYFITTTTSGHNKARPNYNGVQVIDFYPNGTIKFPYAPPFFIGFKNASRATVYNSIPTDPHPQRAPSGYVYLHANIIVGPGAYTLMVTNKYTYPLDSVVVLPLPALHVAQVLNSTTKKGSSIEVLDYRNVTLPTGAEYTFLAVKLHVAPQSNATLMIAAEPDKEPPKASLEYTIPSKPVAGEGLRVFIRVSDDSSGLLGQPAVSVVDDKGRTVKAQVLMYPASVPGDMFLYIPSTPSDASYLLVKVRASDPAGHTGVSTIKIPLAAPQATTTTATHSTATSTHTTQASSASTQAASTPATPSTTTGKARSSALVWAAVGVVIVIVIAAAVLLARR